MLTSIIIPTYNALPLLRETISSIRRHTKELYELIVVDNGSTDGTLDFLKQQRIITISLPANTGFPAACNWGLRLARGEWLVLLNNDVLVTAEWLSRMQRTYDRDASIGIVGPLTNYASGRQQVAMTARYEEFAAQLSAEQDGKQEKVNRIIGFCMLFSRTFMKKVGLLDEQFSPGHFEDDDYCYRAYLAGYRVVIAKDAFVYHHGSASFGSYAEDDIRQLLERNRQLFMDKWGIDPLELSDEDIKGERHEHSGAS
ncbi:glycosyltransferase family 2 protein [Paenibacillus glycanilyticus]|uniref:glycosyltransferase family 2 protein n=1 Tax=Paenibacillus glycanilyticus TaxID=126569 RepID=UPI00203FC517|nr:glycosyltransferase family 2 protein [Paenibacillus glycanilyticus]MCM3626014.1 glycosyltransferase family 2 protein [Paenibacillus glycanilyticus]